MYKFGIDIGGTSIKIGCFSDNKLFKKYQIKTDLKDNGIYIFDSIALSIKEFMLSEKINEDEVIGFGFGVPGNVISNYINFCPNLGLRDFNIEACFKKHFNNKIIVSSNDANYAALGEMTMANDSNCCFITLGTGVGGGIIIKNKLIIGASGAGGEIGHIHIDDVHNYKCTCGLTGCLETVASATGIVRLYNEYANSNTKISAEAIFNLAKADDPMALKVVDEAALYLGKTLAIIAVTVDPGVFIIGGGVSLAGDILLDRVKKYFKQYAHYAVKNTEIKLATLKNDAGIYGAMFAI